MGITGLIPFLEKATRKITLKDLKGSTVGVDTYCWLHKGAISCAEKLLRGDHTDLHIKYCLKYVNLLLAYGVKPVLVFDGRHLPAKALTEKRRSASRKEAKEKAKELLREGKVQEARTYINRGVNITHSMAHQLIQACRKMNVDCIVAPYEADGQLGYFMRQKIIDYVITEDSDLTLFGCSKVIFKFDLTGQGLLFDADLLHLAMGCKEDRFEFRRFEMMAILSGCDYLDSLKGVGLAKACKFVLMTEETDVRRALKKIPQYLKLKGVTVDEEYIDGFLRAMYTFRHMIVYDPRTRKQVHLTEPEEDELPYCDNAGEKLLDDDTAFQLAIGNVNPFTMEQIDHWDVTELNTEKYPSIWGGSASKKKTTSSNNNVIKTTTTTPTSSKRKLVPVKPPMDDMDTDGPHNTSVDIMNMYLEEPIKGGEPERELKRAESPEPEAKKIRLSSNASDRSSKNPFLKKKKPEDVEEARQEDKKPQFSLLQQANAIKTEGKGSKFRKTVEMDKKMAFVSRFFSPTTAVIDRCKKEQDSDTENVIKSPKNDDDQSQETEIEEKCNEDPTANIDKDTEDEGISSQPDPTTDQVAVNPRESDKSSTTETDTEDAVDCSAFLEVEYSDPSDTQSQRQRENEQSPIPWQSTGNGGDEVDDAVQDTVMEVDDKENDRNAGDVNNNNGVVECNLLETILIDDTPVKDKERGGEKDKKKSGKPGPTKKKLMPSKPPPAKQKTLLSFFKKQ